MWAIRSLLLFVFFAMTACGGDHLPDPSTAPALKKTFAPYFRIGAAIHIEQIDSATHSLDVALLQKHFSSITVENEMKPNTVGVREGQYNFAPADAIVDFAQTNGIAVRAHTLVWHLSAPAWFFDGDRSDPEAYHAKLKQRLQTYVTDVITHFRGKVYAWDVVNEVASDTAGEIYRKSSPWYEAYSIGGNGPDYIEDAFRAARAADPDVKLFLNDYSTERSAKRENVVAIVRDLIGKGAPIDGVGHQIHTSIAMRSSDVDNALTAVEQISPNLLNHITELDVSVYTLATGDYGAWGPPEFVISQQATLYRALFAVFRKHDMTVDSVTTWGVSDAETWLDGWLNRKDRPLLFDTNHNPKWAFWAITDPALTLPSCVFWRPFHQSATKASPRWNFPCTGYRLF